MRHFTKTKRCALACLDRVYSTVVSEKICLVQQVELNMSVLPFADKSMKFASCQANGSYLLLACLANT